METFGKRFKMLRQEQNLTQDELCEKFNKKYSVSFTKSSISQYENDKRRPELRFIENWADFFNVSVDFLLGNSNSRKPLTQSLNLSDREASVIKDFRLLNEEGKKEAEKRVKELTSMPFYRADETVTIAAHSNKPIDEDEMSKIHKDLEEMLKW